MTPEEIVKLTKPQDDGISQIIARTKLTVGDYFKIKGHNGSVGMVTSLHPDRSGSFYGTFFYGRNAAGEPMTANTGFMQAHAVVKIGVAQFIAHAGRDGWGDTQCKHNSEAEFEDENGTNVKRCLKRQDHQDQHFSAEEAAGQMCGKLMEATSVPGTQWICDKHLFHGGDHAIYSEARGQLYTRRHLAAVEDERRTTMLSEVKALLESYVNGNAVVAHTDLGKIVSEGVTSIIKKTRAQTTPGVLQPWVTQLTMMQQSVLISAVRGPDGLHKEHIAKYILRWLRRCILLSSFEKRVLTWPTLPGGGSFTGPVKALTPETREDCAAAVRLWQSGELDVKARDEAMAIAHTKLMEEIFREYLRSVDEVPHHFHNHLMHAAEILGYKHPEMWIASSWHKFYLLCVSDAHLYPESAAQMDRRLGDNERQWREREEVPALDVPKVRP